MAAPEKAFAWLEEIVADPVSAFSALFAFLALTYLIAMVKNLADPSKRDASHARGAAIAFMVLAVSAGGFLLNSQNSCPKVCDQDAMSLEEYRECRKCQGLPD